jgi:hypothetical protein
MNQNTLLPLIGRAAEVREDGIDPEARTIEVVWTTGAVVQRVRWEGWDDRVDYDEELVVSPNAIRLDRLNAGAPFLDTHATYSLDHVLGSVVPGSVRIERGQGHAKVKLTAAPDAAHLVQRILDRDVRHVSVGYRVHRYEITKQEGKRELWRAVDWEPMELSAVALPADPGAHVRSDEGGLAPCVITRDDPAATAAPTGQGATMSQQETAAVAERTEPTPPAQEAASPPAAGETQARAVADERARIAAIDGLCQRANVPADLRQRLINDGSTVEQARSALFDHLVANDPAGRIATPPAEARNAGATEEAYRDAVSAALLHRSGVAGELPPVAREFRGMSPIDLARDALSRRGVNTRGMTPMEVAAAAFEMRSAGYHTTSDFPQILGNVVNTTMRRAYERAARTFTVWARRVTHTDFRPVTKLQVGQMPDLLKVNEHGEFKYGSLGSSAESFKLDTYGRIVALTRQVLVNDQLNVFTRWSEAWGAAAANLEGDIVYGILLNNPTMGDGVALFHATHGNLGSASVISEAGLTAGYRAYAVQKGVEGRSISVLPRFLIVPPGPRMVEGMKQLAATTPSTAAEVNPYAGKLQVVVEPRLIPASGQDPWFLAADPAQIDTVEYAYLEGQEGVYTETRVGFEVDGMEFKARHDFAAAPIDYRGLWKNPGAAPT